MIKCRRCGKGPNEVRAVLQRVNSKGVEGIWECRPICGAQMSDEDAVDAAIKGAFDETQAEVNKQTEEVRNG